MFVAQVLSQFGLERDSSTVLVDPDSNPPGPISPSPRYRRAVRAREHFPTQAAALKCLYLVIRSLDPTGGGRARWMVRWKPASNAFAITFAGRLDRAIHRNRRTSHTVDRTDRAAAAGVLLRDGRVLVAVAGV